MTDKPSVDKSPENVAGMFTDIAPRYDFMNRFLSGFVDVYWRKYAAKRVPIPQGGTYLDVCTDTADLLIEYYRRYKDKPSAYVGCDFCQPMLDIGEKKIQKKIPQPAVPVTLQFGDACALPFEDNSFDTITVAFGLRNTADMIKAIQEMHRVCKPGGTMGILEFSMPTGFFFKRLYLFYFRYILPTLGKVLARNRYKAYNYLPQSVESFPYGQKLADALAQCGWQNVSFTPLTFGIATLYIGTKEQN